MYRKKNFSLIKKEQINELDEIIEDTNENIFISIESQVKSRSPLKNKSKSHLNEIKNNNVFTNRMKSLNSLYESSYLQMKKIYNAKNQNKLSNHTIKEEEELSQNITVSDRLNKNKIKESKNKVNSNEFYEILVEKSHEEQKEDNCDTITRNKKDCSFNSKNLFKSNSDLCQENNNNTYLSFIKIDDNLKKSFNSENKNFELLFKSYDVLSTNDSNYNTRNKSNINKENENLKFNPNGPYNDKFSCDICEEYYKNCIIYNRPINIVKCKYCCNIINTKSLEFYLDKYKYEILNCNNNN